MPIALSRKSAKLLNDVKDIVITATKSGYVLSKEEKESFSNFKQWLKEMEEYSEANRKRECERLLRKEEAKRNNEVL